MYLLRQAVETARDICPGVLIGADGSLVQPFPVSTSNKRNASVPVSRCVFFEELFKAGEPRAKVILIPFTSVRMGKTKNVSRKAAKGRRTSGHPFVDSV